MRAGRLGCAIGALGGLPGGPAGSMPSVGAADGRGGGLLNNGDGPTDATLTVGRADSGRGHDMRRP